MSTDVGVELEPFQIVDKLPDAASDDQAASSKFTLAPSFSYKDDTTPMVIDAHFEIHEQKESPINLSLEPEIPRSGFPSPESSIPDIHISVSVNSADEDKRHESDDAPPVLDEQDDDTIARRLAKGILKEITTVAMPPSVPNGEYMQYPGGFLTQVIIHWHLNVVREMMALRPVDTDTRHVVLYVCKTLETPGVSSISGPVFLMMPMSDQFSTILAIARQYVEPFLSEYDDTTYTEYHRQLDRQAHFYIQTVYHPPMGCCSLL